MGRAQSDTYSSLFTKSDNVNLDETLDRKSALVHVLRYNLLNPPSSMENNAVSTGDKSCIATQLTSSTQWGL